LVDFLRGDGWIEERTDSETWPEGIGVWGAAHDVLADRLLLDYLNDRRATLAQRLDALIGFATAIDCLRPAFLALQRVHRDALFEALNWPATLERWISVNFEAWRAARDLLLDSAILNEDSQIALLRNYPRVWEGAETDSGYQFRLAQFDRSIVRRESAGEPIAPELRATLTEQSARAAPHAVRSNYLLTYGTRLAPHEEAITTAARAWIRAYPAAFEAHYPMVAWLETGLQPSEIRAEIEVWLKPNSTQKRASFVYEAWLDAVGADGRALVEAPIRDWLKEHAAAPDAQFVYKAWLDAVGADGRALVEAPIWDWLKEHATAPDARFVYVGWLDATKDIAFVEHSVTSWLAIEQNRAVEDIDHLYRAWLEVNGSFDLIRDGVLDWVHQHRDEHDAVYVLKFVAGQPQLPIESIRDVLHWCRAFADHEDGLWRLSQLGVNLLAEGLQEEVVTAAETLLEPRLDACRALDADERIVLSAVISNLVTIGRRDPELRSRVDALLLAWLRRPASYGNAPPVPNVVQRTNYFQAVVDLVVRGSLDLARDREPLERFLRWVNAWQPERKAALHRTVTWLTHNHPGDGLWELIDLPAPSTGGQSDDQSNKSTAGGLAESSRDFVLPVVPSLGWLSTASFDVPHWSNVWEELWEEHPGDPWLAQIGLRWLQDQIRRPAWTYVWEPLFEHLLDDEKLLELTLDWLVHGGPRDRGAWGYVWMSLWDRGLMRQQLTAIGLAWLEERVALPTKKWETIHAALASASVEPDRLATLSEARAAADLDSHSA
jgi:hypothetical protein